MLKRLFHLGPDVATLRQRKDVPGLVQPGQRAQYVAALERFRRLGLPVREYEQPESNEVSEFWAEVDFEGEVVVIDGRRGFRDV